MPSSSTLDTASGHATITAIAALGNPRAVAGSSKSLILDTQIYVGSPNCESLMGTLRFFNGADMAFSNDAALYLIYATFVRMEDGVEQLSASDCSFAGDLQWAVPLSASTDCEGFHLDPRQRAYVHVSGPATNCKADAGTFTIDIEQYTSAFKDLKDQNSKPLKSVAPLSCEFSPRYKNKKPTPHNRRYVSHQQFLFFSRSSV